MTTVKKRKDIFLNACPHMWESRYKLSALANLTISGGVSG